MNTTTRWIVGIVIIIIIVIAGVMLFGGAKPTTSTTATTTASSAGAAYGLTEYTDPTYGFSFWYPSALEITASSTTDSTSFPGGIAVETITVGDAGGTEVIVVNSANGTITDEPNGHASPIEQTKYFYDPMTGALMVAHPDGATNGDTTATTTADIGKTTMGGLPMLASGLRFDSTIIPTSPTQFLVVTDGGGSSFTSQLAETVSASGGTIDPTTENSVLQAEATAYGNNQ